MDLRDYQREAIEKTWIRLGSNRSVLLVSPCGSGKTVMASNMIETMHSNGARVLFLAHRRELIDQTAAKLLNFGVDCGIIMSGRKPDAAKRTQVASIQTAIRRALSNFDFIFIDEAHHCTDENSYFKIIEASPSAKIIGMTATPWRLDGNGLADVFESEIIVAKPIELKDRGWLVPLSGFQYRKIDTKHARIRGGDFASESLIGAACSSSLLGEIVEDWRRFSDNKRTAVFCINTLHSSVMKERFLSSGIPADEISFVTPKNRRIEILDKFRSGGILVLCNVNIITEGFDLPDLEVVLLCRPTLSATLYFQMIGRVLRPAPGKMSARIHDHAGLLKAHGHPYGDIDLSMKHSVCKTMRQYEEANKPEPSPMEAKLKIPHEFAATRMELKDPEKQNRHEAYIHREWPKFSISEKRRFYFKMVWKHGLTRSVLIYRWASNETEWPMMQWRARAGEVLDGMKISILRREIKQFGPDPGAEGQPSGLDGAGL